MRGNGQEARAIVRALAAMPSPVEAVPGGEAGEVRCEVCRARWGPVTGTTHAPGCPWVDAVAWAEADSAARSEAARRAAAASASDE